jgi:cytochrome c oxidase assembly factor CtaG
LTTPATLTPEALAPVGWTLEPAAIAVAVLVSLAYARRAHGLARRGRPLPLWRQICFHAGVAVVLLALISPLDQLGETRLFYAHMIQHLAIGELAPLLILLGLSGPMLRPLLALPGATRLRWLLNPLVALPLWALNLYVWHLPVLYEAALENDLLHGFEHACFFWVGMLMWGALIEPLPGPTWFTSGAKVAYVVCVRALGCAILGNALIWIGTPLYPYYGAGEHLSGVAPTVDQQIGGAIMFVWGAFVTFTLISWFFLRWIRESELRQSLLESGAEPRVAARAARYGRRPLGPSQSPPSP